MNLKFVRAICLLAMCLMCVCALAQSYHQLRLNDYADAPSNDGGYIAYTHCDINFTYQPQQVVNGTYYINFEYKLSVDHNQSWINRHMIISQDQLAEVMKHEQGHYNLAYMELQELQHTFSNQRFTSNYKAEVLSIFNRIDARYKQLNMDYDDDTTHMLNRKQQNSWDIWFRRKLGYNYAYAGR